jgi:hypothetical protein
MPAATASEILHHPLYLRRCIACRAPSSSQTAAQTAESASGQSAQNPQRPSGGSVPPQRAQCGGATRRQRERQTPQTSASPSLRGTGASQVRHWEERRPSSAGARRGDQSRAACRAARITSRGGASETTGKAAAPGRGGPRPSAARRPPPLGAHPRGLAAAVPGRGRDGTASPGLDASGRLLFKPSGWR